MRVVEEALWLRGFATFIQAKLELLQEIIDMNIAFQPDVRFMMDHVRGVLASTEEENQEMEVIDDNTQQKKRRAGHGKGRRANKKKKAAKKAPEDEAWLEALRTRPHQAGMEVPAARGSALTFSNIKTIFSTAPTPVDPVPAVASTQQEEVGMVPLDHAAPNPGTAVGQKPSKKITLKFNKALLAESPESAVRQKPRAKPKQKTKAPAGAAPIREWEGGRRVRKAPERYEQ